MQSSASINTVIVVWRETEDGNAENKSLVLKDATVSQTESGNKRSQNPNRDTNEVSDKPLTRTLNSVTEKDIMQLNEVGDMRGGGGELMSPMKLSLAKTPAS